MGNSCSANVAVREEAHIKASEAAAAALHAAETVPQPPEVQDAGTLLLRHFNLEVYLPAFQIAGYTRIEQLLQLSAQDLDAIEQRSHVPILPAHRRLMLSEIWTAWAQECAVTITESAREGAQQQVDVPPETLAAEDTTSAPDAAAEAAAADAVVGSSPAASKPRGSTATAKPSIGGWFQIGPKKAAASQASTAAAAAAQQPVSDQGVAPLSAATDAAAQDPGRPGSGMGSRASSGSDTGSRPSSRQQRRGPSPALQQQVGPLAAGRAGFSSGDVSRTSGRGEVVPSQGHAAVLQRLQRVRDLSRCHPLPQPSDVPTPPGSSGGVSARGMGTAGTAGGEGGAREVPPLSRALYEAAGVIPRTRPLFEEELQSSTTQGAPGLTDPTAAVEGPAAGPLTGPLTRQQPAPNAGATVVVPAATAAALRSPRERAALELLGWAPGGTMHVTSDVNRRPPAAASVQGAQQQGQVPGHPGGAVDQQGSPAGPSSRASSRASSRSGTGSLLQQLGRPGGQHLEDLPLAAYAGGSPGGSATKTAAAGCRTEAGGSSSVRRGPSPSASTASTAGNRLRGSTAAAGAPGGSTAAAGVVQPLNQAGTASDAVASSGPAPASEAAQELLRIVSRAKARLAAKLEASKAAAAAPVLAAPAPSAAAPAGAGATTGRVQAQPAVGVEAMQESGSSSRRAWQSPSTSSAAPRTAAAAAAAPAAAGGSGGCLEDAEELWEVPLPVPGSQQGHQQPAGAPDAEAVSGDGVHTLGGGTVYVRHTSRSVGGAMSSLQQGTGAAVGAGSREGRHASSEEDEVVVLGPEFAATAADLDQPPLPAATAAAATADRAVQGGGGREVAGVRQSQHRVVMVAAGATAAAAAAEEEPHMLLPGQVQELAPVSAAEGWDEWAPSAVVAAHTSRQLVPSATPPAASVPQLVPGVQLQQQQQQQQQQHAGGWEVSPIVQQVAPRALEPTGSGGADMYAAGAGWGSRQDSGVPDVGSIQQEEIRTQQQPVSSGVMPAAPSRPLPAPSAAAAPAVRRRVSEDDRSGVSDAAPTQRPGSRASSAASGSSRGSGGPAGKQRPGGVKDQGATTPTTAAAAAAGHSRARPHSSSTSATPGSKAASKQRPSSGASGARGAAAASPRGEDVAGDTAGSAAAEQQVLRTVRARQKQAQQKATGSGGRLQQPVFRF